MADTFIYVNDSHEGAGSEGFMQQPRRADLQPQIFRGIGELARNQGASLLVHGGDITENGTPSQIQSAAASLRERGLPVIACLGNHDLAERGSLKHWRAASSDSLKIADITVSLSWIDVIILNNAWLGERAAEFYWKLGYKEGLLESQWNWLENELDSSQRPAILVVHASIDAIPPRLTGQATETHAPLASYALRLRELLDRHPRVKLVLSGHNHVTCATVLETRLQLSTSSVIEPPFQVRLIRVQERELKVETLPVIEMPTNCVFHQEKAWTSGFAADQSLEMRWAT